MKVYLGKDLKSKYKEINGDKVLYSSTEFFVATDSLPVISLKISEDQRLFIWGHIYAIHCDDGSLAKYGDPAMMVYHYSKN